MKKSFYLTYATMLDMEEVAHYLDDCFDVEVEKCEDEFFGVYLKCTDNITFDSLMILDGLYKNNLMMVKDIPTEDGLELTNQYAKTIIKFGIYEGQNTSKEAKYKHVKCRIWIRTPYIDGLFVLIEDKIIVTEIKFGFCRGISKSKETKYKYVKRKVVVDIPYIDHFCCIH